MEKKKKRDLIFLTVVTIIVGFALYFLISPIIKSRITDRKKSIDIIERFEKELNKDKGSDGPSSTIDLNKSGKSENKVIGVIYIPKINIMLPIYNNSGEYAISNGAGMMKTYGPPNGKKGTHAVLTSHAGQKNGLFTDLYRLDIGDSFFIKNENGEMAKYNIIEENTVLPDDFSKLGPEKDKCLITLLTCTPLGVNTHRLLQKGEKVKFDMDEFLNMKNPFFISKYELIQLIIAIAILICLIYLYYNILKKPKKLVKSSKMIGEKNEKK